MFMKVRVMMSVSVPELVWVTLDGEDELVGTEELEVEFVVELVTS